MVARVTFAEVDTVRTSIARMLGDFEHVVLPRLHEQAGYEGCAVLTMPAGKAVVVTYWTDDAAADESLSAGIWDANVEQFVTVLTTPAGREAYDVSFIELPTTAAS